MTQVEYLRKHRAYNWQWPDDRGRWFTKAPMHYASQPYHGPTRRVVAGRKRRGRHAHDYKR